MLTDKELRFWNYFLLFCKTKLTDTQVANMMLRYYCDLPLREIARIQEVTHQAIEHSIKKTHQKLKWNTRLRELR